MNNIKELPKSSSHLLSCTQIITSIQGVVKELIENALDSSSKSVEIKIEDYGLEKIEVKDGGCGIHKDDISKVAKPHCTSKIASHLDLNQIQTYGFRGEALAALCAVSDLSITTKTVDEEFGFTHTFGHNGEVLLSKPFPCTQGTTITASNLFKTIPVRKQYYRTSKSKKDELKKIEDMLIAFGCIHTGVRFVLIHNRNLIWQKPAVSKVREGLYEVFGRSVVDHMQNCEFTSDDKKVNIVAFLPKIPASIVCGHSTSNRSIVSINKRPVRMRVIDKVLKEYFSKSMQNKSLYPVCYISINVPASETDVNIEPNKTTVMLFNIDVVIEQLTAILKTFYENNSSIERSNEARTIPTVTKSTSASNIIENFNSDPKGVQNLYEPIIKKSEITVVPSIHKQQHLTHTLQLQNSQSKPIVSKKLSRQSNTQTPTAKRRRSSGSFVDSPIDIQRHINTMESFFESVPSIGLNSLDVNRKIPLEETDASFHKTPMKVTVQRESIATPTPSEIDASSVCVKSQGQQLNVGHSLSTDKSPVVTSLREPFTEIHPSNTKAYSSTLSVQEANLNSFPLLDKTSSFSILNTVENSDSSLLQCENSILTEDTHSGNLGLFSHVNGMNVTRRSTPADNPANTDRVNFQTAKSILENNRNIILDKLPLQSSTVNRADSKVAEQTNLTEVKESPISSVDAEWSRGKITGKKELQPVILLKPQETKACEVTEEIPVLNNSATDKKETNNVTLNQRKMTAFDFFCRKHRLEVASLNPEMNNHQIAQILTEKWTRLSTEGKSVYKNMIDKEYPKNVTNKDKLGKTICQNIDRRKVTPAKPKNRVSKQRTERALTFNIGMMSNCRNSDEREVLDEEVVSCLTPGIWIYREKKKILVLNTFRLQEIIIYQRLLDTYSFEAEPLEFPCNISSNSLGEAEMEMIMQMHEDYDFSNYKLLDERITANGFKINVLRGGDEKQIQIVGMTKNVAFYGVLDLKEILKHVMEKGPTAKLSECRPGKVILYLQGEAIRMARQCPPSKRIEDVEDLLKKMKLLPPSCKVCIHSEPFIHEIHTLL